MRRRGFITLLGGAAATLPLVARAQQAAMPVIGWLSSASAADWGDLIAAFNQGLKQAGFEDERNVKIEYRWAEGHYERLPALTADLVRRNVNVIFATGGHLPPKAAKEATSTIPIVFLSGDDPVQFGLVAVLARPGSNVTGLTMISSALGPKQLALLRELTPKTSTIVLIANSTNPNSKSHADELLAAAKGVDARLDVLTAGADDEIDAVLAAIVERRPGGLILANDPFLRSRTEIFTAFAVREKIPAIYPFREYVTGGGLMSYGASLTHEFRESAIYVGRILNGAKPAELPILQPSKFELVINLKTARALGLTIPSGVLAIADEVIE